MELKDIKKERLRLMVFQSALELGQAVDKLLIKNRPLLVFRPIKNW